MLTITLGEAKRQYACAEGYEGVAKALGPGWKLETPFPLLRVLEVRGLPDALWAMRYIPKEQKDQKRRVVSLWLADVLERVQDQMMDPRSRSIIPLLREHAINPVCKERLEAAYAAAKAAAKASANDAAAYAAAKAAAKASTWAAYDVVCGVYATYAANDAAAYDAYAAAYAYDAERNWQTERLRYYLEQREAN